MPDERFLAMLNQFTRIHNQFSAVKRKSVCRVEDTALFASEMHILVRLKQKPGSSLSDISDALYISASAASQLVKKLVSKGFILKKHSESEERMVVLDLTASGEKAVNSFISADSEGLRDLLPRFQAMADREIDTIRKFLTLLEETFDKKLQ